MKLENDLVTEFSILIKFMILFSIILSQSELKLGKTKAQ